MDPSVVVTAQPPKHVKFPKFLKLKILIPTVLFFLAIIGLIFYLPKQTTKLNKSNQVTQQTQSPSFKLQQSINKTFGVSNKYASIITLFNTAYTEKDLNKKYELYKILFNKISQAYQEKKDPQFLLMLYKLRDYMKNFPKFNQDDFVIPK